MKLSAYCMTCMVNRQMDGIRDLQDEELKSNYMKEVFRVISEADEKETAPVTLVKINQLHQQYFGIPYSFEELKIKYNSMMLEKESDIWRRIQISGDPLLEALKFARIGNYIDFGAMGSIDDNKLNSLLNTVDSEEVDEVQYQSFRNDLKHAGKLVYLTDNCGEIVFDKLLIKCLTNVYPQLDITVIVRGKMILNDATLDDARFIGLTEVADVIDNGTEIAGTSLERINKKARERIDTADVIISKGQGNFESLYGCSLNIYYVFLCKCDWFVKRFGMERYQGVFINEKSLPVRG